MENGEDDDEDGAICDLDLDGQGGKTFLRVLLLLTMHEVLQAFKQVQLLVSDSDVESYKQIKADLDGLRLLVEKSELWVYKAKMATAEDEVGSPGINGGGDEKTVAIKKEPLDILDEEGQGQPDSLLLSLDNNNSIIQNYPMLPPNKKPAVRGPMLSSSDKQGSAIDLDIGPPLDESQAINYKQIQQILARMNRLCVQPILSTTSSSGGGGSVSGSGVGSGGGLRPRKHEQRLLRNMGVHAVVLDLLQIPYDRKEHVRMNELMRLAHEFLQNFYRGNQPNQALLHKHLELFLTPGVISFFLFEILR
jgi:inositol 1,4,5-triphosphate receptor type 1